VQSRLGILAGSFLSAIVGIFLLLRFCPPRKVIDPEALDGGLLGPHDEHSRD